MNPTMKVLLLDGVAPKCAELLEEQNFEVVQQKKMTAEELKECIAEFDAIAIRSATKLTKELIEKGAEGRLKLVVRVGAGVNNIDVEEATRHSIVVENTPGTNARAVIELTIGALIAMARNIVHAHLSLKEGKWEKKKFAGKELRGKTIGIIGLGRIGQGVAELARRIGMTVVGYDPLLTPTKAAEVGVDLMSLEEVCARADFLTLHAALTDESRGMINADLFALMKDGVCIANCARAELVEEQALVEALESGKVAYYYTDVFKKEPPDAEDPIVRHEKTIVTPHVGGSTGEASLVGAKQAAEQIAAFLKNEEIINSVNIAPGDPELRAWEGLAAKLGSLAYQLTGPERIETIEVIYEGSISQRDVRRVTAHAVAGFLRHFNEQATPFNAMQLASDMGIEVREARKESRSDQLVVSIDGAALAGVCMEEQHVLKRVGTYAFDLALDEEHYLFSEHTDMPGIVGVIGTILGGHKINIQKMVLRDVPGQPSRAIISVREPVDAPILDEIVAAVQDRGGQMELKSVRLPRK